MKGRVERFRNIRLDVGPWNTYVSVFIGGERRQRMAVIARCKVPESYAQHWAERMRDKKDGALTMFTEETPGNVFVYFPRTPKHDNAQDLGAVAHEMLHVAVAILRRKGITLCHESEEAFAYLTEFLVREFWAEMKVS